MKYIDADRLKVEIEKHIKEVKDAAERFTPNMGFFDAKLSGIYDVMAITDSLQQEQPEAELYNNGWIDCTKQMPKETKHCSDTLQGHREWSESDRVLVWDSIYGRGVDATKNGKWMSEQRGGYTGQVVHGIIAWRPIPEFNEELLFKARKED